VLAHSVAAREVQVRQAQGEREAAVLRAEAIKIVGQATKDFPEYRQQEFIGAFAEAVKEGKISQIIYVPTEANIPITEARRFAPNK
jgi:regulator of protease activity HflC (stomatin/prohibitin superfamily)